MKRIVDKDHPTLRGHAKGVEPSLFGTPKLIKILTEMREALEREDDGVALAAPQIGVSLRIFVVSPRAYSEKDKSKPLIFINPRIVKRSKRERFVDEGCLSIRWLYGEVKRSSNATIEAYDEYGKRFTRGGGGILAQIFQHEIDHLDGILFTDKARGIRNIPPDQNV